MIRTTLCSRDSVAGKGGGSDRWFHLPLPPAHTLPKCAVRSSALLLAFFSDLIFRHHFFLKFFPLVCIITCPITVCLETSIAQTIC
jgi:hypothetical protein